MQYCLLTYTILFYQLIQYCLLTYTILFYQLIQYCLLTYGQGKKNGSFYKKHYKLQMRSIWFSETVLIYVAWYVVLSCKIS
jgi:hypothetical protein